MAVALPLAARRFLPGEEWLGLVGLIPLLGALVAMRFQRKQQFLAAARTVAVTAVVFTTAMFGWAVLRVDRHQQNQLLLTMIERAGGNPRIGAFGRLEPTWVFYGGRSIDELTLDPAVAAAATGPWKPKPRPLAPDFFGRAKTGSSSPRIAAGISCGRPCRPRLPSWPNARCSSVENACC